MTNEKLEQTAAKREQLREEREKEKAERVFAPPQLPTPPSDSFEDNFVTDESTFAPPRIGDPRDTHSHSARRNGQQRR